MKKRFIETRINTRPKIESVLKILGEKNVEGKRETLESKLNEYSYRELVQAVKKL